MIGSTMLEERMEGKGGTFREGWRFRRVVGREKERFSWFFG